jgi:serine/threonine protein kinase
MGKKTRKIKRNTIGEGFYGKAYNLGCKTDSKSICSILESETIEKITLYTVDTKQTVITGDDIHDFLRYIHTAKHKIGKIFKNVHGMVPTSAFKNFESEIHDNIRIIEKYGHHSAKYLTIIPDTTFRGLAILGAHFELAEKQHMYIVFSTKCNNKYGMKFKKFMIDLLESIVILHKAGYRHNDIKLDNIVLCKDTYKLIDWGQASSVNKTEFGDPISTNPIHFYTMGYSYLTSRGFMKLQAEMVDFNYANSQIFNEIYMKVMYEFDSIVGRTIMPYKLIHTYKDTFDVFMIGMTGLHAIFRYNLDYKKYRPLILAFTSLTEPMEPVAALAFAKNFFKSV